MPENDAKELADWLRAVRNRELFRAYVLGQSVEAIAASSHLSASTVKHTVNRTLLALWDMIRAQRIAHPYNQVVYPQAYRDDQFKPRYLVKDDLVKHHNFWTEMINRYAEKA